MPVTHRTPTAARTARKEPCRLCSSLEGEKIGEIDFWDLQRSDLVRCPDCGHVQLDPMLTELSTSLGCRAYHYLELSSVNPREQRRNLLRAYRRGVLFGHDLARRGIRPARILEFGPGTGYFAAGLKRYFPDAEITVADVVDDVLARIRKAHGFRTVRATPERIGTAGPKFDLVIARDVMEHVGDAGLMIRKIARLLAKNGTFHFLVPNGREDAWSHQVRWRLSGKPSELLLNHVNYFDGKGLLRHLAAAGFEKLGYYTYDVKSTRRGKGWLVSAKRAAPLSVRRSARRTIRDFSGSATESRFDREEVLDAWYLKTRLRWVTVLVCWLRHNWWIRLDPGLGIGHEIFGLFRKT